MTVIIGIDPGSRRTGYGIIRFEGYRYTYLASGHVDLTRIVKTDRLRQLFLKLQDIVQVYRPDEAAIEQVFMHENAQSALKLGQARGAAMVAFSIPVAEYSAREIKKSVVGHGAAGKSQVQYMVQRLLNLKAALQADAADALAVALCHAQSRHLKQLLKG
ncbi:MAG: crossover junction endodeoxyribonuclease RuvC [Gammaproteobacteria bacterium RIFCSPHIGHO2_12_FULL_38_14]|nr:MAG: crossover junction endodeoxyribonuclease RuvC [Gammaproteobacteria bacterium RIFCSPHIGHO2_12_FULL_38_14]